MLGQGAALRTIGYGSGEPTRSSLPRANAYEMIWHGEAAGIKIGNHSFRAAGITAYLKNGTLEKAAAMANTPPLVPPSFTTDAVRRRAFTRWSALI